MCPSHVEIAQLVAPQDAQPAAIEPDHQHSRASAAGAVFAGTARMFTVDLAEYVRLSYASLEDACQAHADAALRLARWSTVFRVATLVATGVSAGLALASATWRPSWYIAAAVAAVSAFAASAAYAGFNQHSRIHGHRACSARLWLVCEQYRELLVEMDGGLIELPALRARRHALLQEASAVFEHVAPVDRYTFAIARRALGARSGAPVSVPAC